VSAGARMSAEDWESCISANGLPDSCVIRHVWDAGFDTGYRRGWREARSRAVSWPEMAIGLAVTALVVPSLLIVLR
jgi:hypothetical protein